MKDARMMELFYGITYNSDKCFYYIDCGSRDMPILSVTSAHIQYVYCIVGSPLMKKRLKCYFFW